MKKRQISLLILSLIFISLMIILFIMNSNNNKRTVLQSAQQTDSFFTTHTPSYPNIYKDTLQDVYEDSTVSADSIRPGYNPFNGDFIVRIDTLPETIDEKYMEAEKQTELIGVIVIPFCSNDENHKDYSLFENKAKTLQSFLGNSRAGFEGWSKSEEFMIVKTLKSSYLINPDAKPVFGLLIATLDSEPVFYAGAESDLIEIVKKHFGINTREEFQDIIRKNIQLKQAHIKTIYDSKYIPSNYHYSPEQIKLLNEYIVKYALELNIFTILPELDLFFKGKVRHARISFLNEGNAAWAVDTSVINLDFDPTGRLIQYHKFDFYSPQTKQYYNFSYDSNGLIDSVTSNYTGSSYKTYAYNDKIQLVKIPYHHEDLGDNPPCIIIHLTSDDFLPYEMNLAHGVKYTFKYDEQRRQKSRERTFNGERTFAKHTYTYDKNGFATITADFGNDFIVKYKYSKNKIEVASSKGTFIQTIEYDRHKNKTAATFDKRTKWSETIDRFYQYEYY